MMKRGIVIKFSLLHALDFMVKRVLLMQRLVSRQQRKETLRPDSLLLKKKENCVTSCKSRAMGNYLPGRQRLRIKSPSISTSAENKRNLVKQTHQKLQCLSASEMQQDVQRLCKSLHRIKVFTETSRSPALTLLQTLNCSVFPPSQVFC